MCLSILLVCLIDNFVHVCFSLLTLYLFGIFFVNLTMSWPFIYFVNLTIPLYNVRCISHFVHFVHFDYLVYFVSLTIIFVIHVTFPFALFLILSISTLCTPSILFRFLDYCLKFLHDLLKVPPFGRVLLPTLQHQAVAGLGRVIRGFHSVPYNDI